jgi:hypothetical protein
MTKNRRRWVGLVYRVAQHPKVKEILTNKYYPTGGYKSHESKK